MENRKSIPNKKGGIYYEHRLLSSEAYWSLTGREINVLNIFYLKRQLIDKKSADRCNIKPNDSAMVRNNGEIIFTYAEAEKYGILKNTFTHCIDSLTEVGFIDIAEPGGSAISTKYSISDRWVHYNTPKFVDKKRKKSTNQRIGYNSRYKKQNNGCNK